MSRDLSQATVYKDKVRPSSAVSRWSMDSSDVDSGVIKDSWGSNDGTINGASTGVSGVGGSEAFSFDGSDDEVEVADDVSLEGFSEMTVSAWIKFDSVSSDGGIIGKNHNSTWEIWFDESAANSGRSKVITFIFSDSSGSRDRIESKTSLKTNEWCHIVAVHYGDGAKIFLNGVVDGTKNTSVVPDATDSDPVTIGNWSAGYPFDGKIDDVRLYNEALTQQQVWKLYNIGRNANWGYSRS